MTQKRIPSLQMLAYNRCQKCQKDYCPEIIKKQIERDAIQLIINAYTRARRNPNFCIPHPNIYYMHTSAPCKYPPRDSNGNILMTKNSLIRCIISKVNILKYDAWPPPKLTWWNVTAFLNGRIDAFDIPHPYAIVGVCADDEVSISTFYNILKAARPSLSIEFLTDFYSDFLGSEILVERIYNEVIDLALKNLE